MDYFEVVVKSRHTCNGVTREYRDYYWFDNIAEARRKARSCLTADKPWNYCVEIVYHSALQ